MSSWRQVPIWLWLIAPLSIVGAGTAIAGLAVDSLYRLETDAWIVQARAQDLVDLAVGFPVLAVAAWRTARTGSLAWHVVTLGALVNIAYAYVIYAFDVHFGPAFLGYVAVLSLSIWSLILGLAGLDKGEVAARISAGARVRTAGRLLTGIALVFGALWLSEDISATLRGVSPTTLAEVGLAANPVHVLDLGFFLPAMLVAGITLSRSRRPGLWLGSNRSRDTHRRTHHRGNTHGKAPMFATAGHDARCAPTQTW